MRYFAGLDIGGTHGRLKVRAENGEELGVFQAEGCSINTDGYEKSRIRCRLLVLTALDSLQLTPQECDGICVAASGIDSDSLEYLMRSIFEEMGFRPQILDVMNDCEVFLHLSSENSLVLVSGTGSICFGRGVHGEIVRTGGWNHIVSDEGSGFDMGLQVLKFAANVLDGRVSSCMLSDLVFEMSGLHTLELMNDFVNKNLFEKSEIAAFAKIGYRAAKVGDAAAIQIHKNCADALYNLVVDTLKKLHLTTGDLWLWGSMIEKNNIIQELLKLKLQNNFPLLSVKIPQCSALDMAILIARNNKEQR